MYQVLARRWRPQNFDELVGQSQVTRTLSNAITAGRLAHAYIFAGLRGTGKTTVARILAKCLNCERGPSLAPCAACAACLEIAESRAIDVLEIDAASRTKVEQTRELLEVVSYAPVRDRYKILIIDEAHMLSKASFNALLKTLEEPPANVLFVLATTELQKVLPTIVSRCQVFEFRRVGVAEVAEHLRRICEREGIAIPASTLARLARAGEGSVRDSLSLLERAIAFSGNAVQDQDVLLMLGAVRAQVLTDWVGALARRDAGALLSVLDDVVDEGQDLVHFWNALIAAVRDLLVAGTLPGRPELLSRSAEESAALTAAADGLSREDLTRVFQILADLEGGLKSSSQPRFLFEAALIRLAGLRAVRPIEELLQSFAASPTDPLQKKKPVDPERPLSAAAIGGPTATAGRVVADGPRDAPAAAAQFFESVLAVRPMLGAMLAQATSVRWDGRALVIGFPASMGAVKRQVEAPDCVALLRKEAARLLGASEVRVEVAEGPVATEPTAPPQTSAEPKTAQGSARARDVPGESEGLLEQARAEPGIRRLMDAFAARVVDIRRHDAPAKRSVAGRNRRPPEDTP